MTLIDKDTKIRLRGETGLSFGMLWDRFAAWLQTRIKTARDRRVRRRRILWLLDQEDWKLEDMGFVRGQLVAELEQL